ncbi:hypothetical protein CC85DRAFT_288519 [Cutaneotrichosporon oleaginosum]|uniref:MFS general substrate transporter n=1 Tax=Cutaneotrichosporon oleaginosum TaxID=879819 RepID=A0A0J0XEH1_9TREE|nr:uncharacterized protein CC85DRAFT_288519 [Cutaneotrichosporon oleaginosum]KLT39466.1 hypothetical protein CC85DRAFT_288519 [Cutaneotrichosporon oleaginosum]TXT09973.1 hypothetical protein COLE_03907 [Cutaneotrichosporon oleaginosum]
MTGSFMPVPGADEYELSSYDAELGAHSVQWVGTPGVKGPAWAKLPLLTVGVLGTQVVWSIEMGYASPFLLELGLSKSWMSLVFVAGPLSGLIVQPLIGAYADRSRSRFGRRRPFMLAGTGVAVVAMMLLGWSREVAGLFGFGNGGAIACAVFSIYLIDFSINAVMSTDRALIVDTLPPQQQEAGNAWAGRMAGVGGVAGFFVGNIDLTTILRWLGNTQLQILSFLTSTLLALAHTSTSWAVTERVLLRDDREQSRSGVISAIRSIWRNMFTLPPSIRTVCFIQFFANLGWYPVLFWTSLWVSDIYKQRTPQGDLSAEVWQADAVRAGSRALFLQAVITLGVSIGAPFLVTESGIRSHNACSALARDDDEDDDGRGTPNSAQWKREEEERARLPLGERVAASVAAGIKAVRSGSAWALPIPGLTLIRFWTIGQAIFAICMFLTWFTTSVGGAYFVIATTGISWALAGWVPYALLGELVLVDPSNEPRTLRNAPVSEVVFSADAERSLAGVHSRSHSRALSHETLGDGPHPLSRLAIPGMEPPDIDEDTTVVLRHSGESERSVSPGSPAPAAESSTADKAGLILGIHNVFIVLPQFLITAISAVIFHMMDATPAPVPGEKEARAATDGPSSPDAVGLVFRIGGASAAAGAYLSYRLARRWQRGEA